jgi:hypothetical protein
LIKFLVLSLEFFRWMTTFQIMSFMNVLVLNIGGLSPPSKYYWYYKVIYHNVGFSSRERLMSYIFTLIFYKLLFGTVLFYRFQDF